MGVPAGTAWGNEYNKGFGTRTIVLRRGRAILARGQATTDHVGDMSGLTIPGVGADLRTARERLGYDLADVAAAMRIRPEYIGALEDGRINDIPGIAYAKAYLRSYALILGLDPDDIYRKFNLQTDIIQKKTDLEFPAPMAGRS